MKAIITFQGFTESESGPSGTEDLYYNIVRPFAGDKVMTYLPRRWNSNTESLMQQLTRFGIHDVILIGYSWGAGYAAMKFAKLARKYGVRIPLALLCDPVYRPTWMPGWLPPNPLNIFSLTSETEIKVPSSIRNVVYVRQKLSIPNGHTLVVSDPHQVIHPPRFLNYSHTGIDESSEWHAIVKNELTLELK